MIKAPATPTSRKTRHQWLGLPYSDAAKNKHHSLDACWFLCHHKIMTDSLGR
ncbi:hypothetical protein BJX66DRAFT_320925 [Aspergillus keveii]|uniref:Uncharacterized protein n=1 Tax=Aspergillus keveii TaxID=714993 RepID=A0ABR4FGI9_9EURO